MKNIFILFLIIGLTFLTFGCAGEVTTEQLEGNWKAVEQRLENKDVPLLPVEQEVIHKFSSNDTLITILNDEILEEIKYEIVDNKQIKTFPEGKDPIILEYKFKGDKLTLIGDAPDGKTKLTLVLKKQ